MSPEAKIRLKQAGNISASTTPSVITRKVYYDPQSIKRTPEGLVQMWIKQIEVYETEEAKQRSHAELIENRQLNRFPLKGYEKSAYSTTLLEIDCAKRLERLPCIKDYDESGRVIGKQCIRGNSFSTSAKAHY